MIGQVGILTFIYEIVLKFRYKFEYVFILKFVATRSSMNSIVFVAVFDNFEYIGCYKDSGYYRDLPIKHTHRLMTVERCNTTCEGYKYFGLQVCIMLLLLVCCICLIFLLIIIINSLLQI